jgi:choline dehydrogenase-like flavoprotein
LLPSLGPRTTVTVSKEIIVSAGVINSPQILLQSGIGDDSALRNLGISPVVHLPAVGKNVTVHIGFSASYFVNATGLDTYDDILRNATLREELIAEWEKKYTGPLANAQASFVGFVRLPEDSEILKTFGDQSPGPRTGHFQAGLQVCFNLSAIEKSNPY